MKKKMLKLDSIEKIRKVTLQPEDVVVIRIRKEDYDSRAIHYIEKQIREQLHRKVIFLIGNIELGVMGVKNYEIEVS
jgi:hypothetical protein